MSEPICVARGCGQPSPGAPLCGDCTQTLRRDLASVPWIMRELATTLAKLDKITAHAGALASDGDPMPLRFAAVQAASTLHLTLGPWARDIAQTRGLVCDVPDTPNALALWLVRASDAIRQSPDAGQCHDEISYAVRCARRVVDRPPRLFYAAPCDQCGTDLYAVADDHGRPVSSVLICRHCDARYDTTKRREWLLTQVEDRIATATEIAAALPAVYGAPINVHTVRQWISRGRLVPRGWLHAGRVHAQRQAKGDRPLCRIGDVLDLAGQRERDHAS